MEGIVDAVVRSIFQPGTAPMLVPFINGTIGLLILTIAGAFLAGFGSIHLYILGGLSLGLLASVNWVISEYKKIAEQEAQNPSSHDKSD